MDSATDGNFDVSLEMNVLTDAIENLFLNLLRTRRPRSMSGLGIVSQSNRVTIHASLRRVREVGKSTVGVLRESTKFRLRGVLTIKLFCRRNAPSSQDLLHTPYEFVNRYQIAVT
jgi:hypothetical protein